MAISNKSLTNTIKLFSLIIFLFSSQLFADRVVSTGFFSDKAVSGYDSVAYFSEGKAVKGDKKYKFKYKDADWYFKNQENLELFKASPETYAPQYGGYCAWSVSQGNNASSDPTQWTIVDGKLYLNYDKEIQQRWLVDKENLIISADKNWPGVLD